MEDAPSSWRPVTASTSVMSKWYAARIILRLEGEEESEGWKQLDVGGIGGISCRHLQVLMTLLQSGRRTGGRTCVATASRGDPAMYLTSMDIKTAFDVARPMHTAKITGDHNVHGWITAAILRETILRRYLSFFTRCIRQGSVEAPGLWLKRVLQNLWSGARMEEEKDGSSTWRYPKEDT